MTMEIVKKALEKLGRDVSEQECEVPISYHQFLNELVERPDWVIRNVFQVFHDMVKEYVGEGFDEYPDDPESISYVFYDFNKLLVEGVDNPFFADRVFANRFMAHVEALKRGAQQKQDLHLRRPARLRQKHLSQQPFAQVRGIRQYRGRHPL